MGDDDDAPLRFFVHLLEHRDEVLEAPEIDARLGFVKDGQRCAAGEDGRDLDALELAPRERSVDLAVDVVARAEADLREIAARLPHRDVLARRERDEVLHRDALEAHGLLEGERDAPPCPLGDGKGCDVLPVEEEFAARRREDARNDLGERALAAAIGARDRHEALVDREGDVVQDALALAVLLHLEADILKF